MQTTKNNIKQQQGYGPPVGACYERGQTCVQQNTISSNNRGMVLPWGPATKGDNKNCVPTITRALVSLSHGNANSPPLPKRYRTCWHDDIMLCAGAHTMTDDACVELAAGGRCVCLCVWRGRMREGARGWHAPRGRACGLRCRHGPVCGDWV